MPALTPFDTEGRFYRGNLHTHSTRSDGALEPAEVARRYRAMGYDFFCLSDHFLEKYSFPITDTTGFRTEDFTTLIGAELHAPALANGEIWHILAVGLPFGFAPVGADETGVALARRAKDAGAFIAIAHPQWYGLTIEDARQVAFADAVEVYNHTCRVLTDRPDGTAILDQMWLEGLSPLAIATDDAHFRDPNTSNADAFGGWVMVKAEANTPEALLAALKAGRFYASQGPDFRSVTLDGSRLVVECSAVSRVTLLGPRARSATLSGASLTRAEFDVANFAGGFLRVVLIDDAGKRAWSNPLRVPA